MTPPKCPRCVPCCDSPLLCLEGRGCLTSIVLPVAMHGQGGGVTDSPTKTSPVDEHESKEVSGCGSRRMERRILTDGSQVSP